MRAVCWNGVKDVRVETVPDPEIVNPRDAIIKITSTAICGSDLHLYDGYIPGMMPGDILGHEFMGEVVDVGPGNERLKKGDRVVVPFTISCGSCGFCESSLFAACDNSVPADKADMADRFFGKHSAGMFGYSHLTGGYAGGQAEYARVPFSDVGPIKVPQSLRDEQVLFLSDILPTGYMAAENCNIRPGDTVAIWGCGPVGQFAVRCAFLLGAARVIAIDHHENRLNLAASAGAETINFKKVHVLEALAEMTGGTGPDSCLDAVGMESHGMSFDNVLDFAKKTTMLGTDRPHALREAIVACRKGGTVSIAGVYGGLLDMVPMGAAFNKGLQFRMGQTHVQRYLPMLLDLIEQGRIDPSFVISHRMSLEEAPEAYRMFKEEQDSVTKVVLH